jgi:hypothetical protein
MRKKTDMSSYSFALGVDTLVLPVIELLIIAISPSLCQTQEAAFHLACDAFH